MALFRLPRFAAGQEIGFRYEISVPVTVSDEDKLTFAFTMLFGRLEIFTPLVLLTLSLRTR